jgi:DNA-binding GntR family transcriptional regulator
LYTIPSKIKLMCLARGPTPLHENPESEAYGRLRAEIIDGLLSPNARLVEQDLSDHLGVSRPAVRLALIRLEHDGLVVRARNRGARVRLVPESEAIEILEARAALEGLAAHHAAIVAGDDEIAMLRQISAEQAADHARGDLLAMSAANTRLHRAIIEASRHQTVSRLSALLGPQLVQFQYRTILQPGRPEQSLQEHAEILDAIAAHDAQRAERAMRTHLANVTATLRSRAQS